MKELNKEIEDFISNRPSVVGIIGYGSGVNPQIGQQKRKPQIDLIVIVDDIKKWHKENIEKNKNDYSFSGRLFFKMASKRWLKAGGKICYMTYIQYNNREYKIGTIEKTDFLDDLKNWSTFYIAGRMQKPILVTKADNDIIEALQYNRNAGLMVTKMLMDKGEINKKDFYIKLACLSYIGDTRMLVAENPDKVKNIVEGSFDFYEENYGKDITISLTQIKNDKDVSLDNLPSDLKEFIKYNDDKIEEQIKEFLIMKNKSKSIEQTIKGIFTTGPVKAFKYAIEKLKRKQKK